MATKNFIVHNGLTVGPLSIDAATGDIVTTGTLTASSFAGIEQLSKNDSSVTVIDTGALSTIDMTLDGTSRAVLSAGALDIPTGSTFQINSADMLTSTGLGSTVINSSLTSLGTITNINITGGSITGTSLPAGDVTYTPAGNISAITVSAALGELDSEKAGLSLNNVFTGLNKIQGTAPGIRLLETGAAVDLGNWNFVADGSIIQFQTLTDIETFIASPFQFSRNGNLLSSGDITATNFIGSGTSLTGVANTGSANTFTNNNTYDNATVDTPNVVFNDAINNTNCSIDVSAEVLRILGNYRGLGNHDLATFDPNTDVANFSGQVKAPDARIDSATPRIYFNRTDAAVDAKLIRLNMNLLDFRIQSRSDADVAQSDLLIINRATGDLTALGSVTATSFVGTADNATKWAGGAKTVSTAAPSGGVDGDVWFKY